MKHVFLIVIIMSFGLCLYGQNGGLQTLKCVYLEEAINRADQPDKITQDEFVLLLKVTIRHSIAAMHANTPRRKIVLKEWELPQWKCLEHCKEFRKVKP